MSAQEYKQTVTKLEPTKGQKLSLQLSLSMLFQWQHFNAKKKFCNPINS